MKKNILKIILSLAITSLFWFFGVNVSKGETVSESHIKAETGSGGTINIQIENTVNGQKIEPIEINRESGSVEVNQKIQASNGEVTVEKNINFKEANSEVISEEKNLSLNREIENQAEENQRRAPEKVNFQEGSNDKKESPTATEITENQENNIQNTEKEEINKSSKKSTKINLFNGIFSTVKKFFQTFFNFFINGRQ